MISVTLHSQRHPSTKGDVVVKALGSDGCLVAPAVFKTVVTSNRGQVGSIPSLSANASLFSYFTALMTREDITRLTALSSCAG